MKTLTIQPQAKRYGITERKKAELDQLSNQVIDAQYDVNQLQAVVTALTEKSEKFAGFLIITEQDKAQALSNRNLLDSVVQNALDLKSNSEISFNETVGADSQTKEVAIEVKKLIDKLIYSAEVINKLSNLVIRKKAMNPLISDELVSIIGQAGKDANSAVALTLVALKSTFASQASSVEAESVSSLEYIQSMQLYEILTGTNLKGQKIPEYESCLQALLYTAYKDSETKYSQAHKANTETLKQLNTATSDLTKAQIKLRSLQSGLAAANAAAFAS